MSRRNALLAATVAVLAGIAFFIWPEPASADINFSGRFGGKAGHGAGVGARLHLGDRAVLHGGILGRGSFHHGRKHHRVHLGDRFRHYQHERISKHDRFRHGRLLGDRLRVDQHERLSGRSFPSRVLLGDVFLYNQRRRLDEEFLGPDFRDGHRDWKRHHRGLHAKFLRPRSYLLPYGGADVIVREVIVPVPVPAERPAAVAEPARVEPRGRVRLVGEEEGIVGDWAPGDRLPDNVPHVALDPVAYGLPDPPFGEKYARVGNDVLRIEAGSRRIVEIVAR